jgi:hypothetical protein
MLPAMSHNASEVQELPVWPAAERNKQPIAEVLQRVLAASGTLLEIASGTGQHALHFAEVLEAWRIQPSDCDPEHLATLQRRVALAGNPRLLPPLALDVTAVAGERLPLPEAPSAVYCANMLHIAPWLACVGLFRWAGVLLGATQPLITYGPYAVGGSQTSESNAEFDASLRARNPDWGVRDVGAIEAVAGENGFVLEQRIPMPANNFCLVWRKPSA